ncbi:MAG: arginine--tRNA ligase [archaeon]
MFRADLVQFLAKQLSQKEEVIDGLLEIPDFKLGHYALPCFFLAKEKKQAPQTLAATLVAALAEQQPSFVEKIVAVGSYVNIFIKQDLFSKALLASIFSPKQRKNGKRIMVEFSNPNTHKEFHVGHLRNAFLGQAIINLLRHQGHVVIPANYIGDIGTHVAKSIWCYKKFHLNDITPVHKGQYLGRLYVEASALVENDAQAKQEVSEVLQLIEQRDPEMTALWKETRQWSLDELHAIYDELGIHFDVWYFESDVDEEGRHIVDMLLKKNIAEKSDGAIIVDLKQYGLDVFLILKSDGTTLYSTKDLALAQRKFNEYKLDMSIYIVDIRQRMHFQQLFKTLELMGFHKPLYHISYEFVGTKEGPIASRTGNVYLYENIRDRMLHKLVVETRKRHPDWDESRIQRNAMTLTIGALKFGMLKLDNNRTIIFDEDEWLDFEGETGPYVQYAYARLNSILGKAKDSTDAPLLPTTVPEQKLVSLLAAAENMVEQAARQYKPNILCRYVLDLAQASNEFYHACPIITADDQTRDARIVLVKAVMRVLKDSLALLGIAVVDAM